MTNNTVALNRAITQGMFVNELEEYGLDVRTIASLERANIIHLKELLYMTDTELRRIRNIGPATIKQIKEAVLKVGEK